MARFQMDYQGVGEMLRSAEMETEMRRRAEKVAAQAIATAPVETGEYKASISVSSTRRGGKDHDRAAGTVTANSPHSFFVEYGTRNNPRHRTLGKALDAARD